MENSPRESRDTYLGLHFYMKSIKARFDKIRAVRTAKSDYICFAEAITGQKFSREMISIWFPKLVDKNDYAKSEKRSLIPNLVKLSMCAEEL